MSPCRALIVDRLLSGHARQHLLTGAERGEGDGNVQGRGSADHHGVDCRGEGRREISEGGAAVGFGDRGAQCITGITTGNEGAAGFLETAPVPFTDIAAADHKNEMHQEEEGKVEVRWTESSARRQTRDGISCIEVVNLYTRVFAGK